MLTDNHISNTAKRTNGIAIRAGWEWQPIHKVLKTDCSSYLQQYFFAF